MRATLLLLLLLLVGFAAGAEDVTVSFLGHSCFTLWTADGPAVMLDPYATYVPYPALPQAADIVLMTHGHIDHCPYCYGETDRVTGDPITVFLLDEDGRCRQKLPPASWIITPEFSAHAIEGNHVTAEGGGSGWVCMFSFEIGGVRFAHLGDLGRVLSATQASALADVDVVFIPVGGAYTIDAAEAMTVIAQLPSVKVIFPMHYRVDGITPWSAMAPLSDFTDLAEQLYPVREIGGTQIVLNPEALPELPEVWILDYES
ncbi:MBL fold metallo-hydrolase [Candidatus Bipolaricaulota bacterium]|nr:MBL fold metallo-hydrolase [Candidatus Bipolaricaulota bacterium]